MRRSGAPPPERGLGVQRVEGRIGVVRLGSDGFEIGSDNCARVRVAAL